MQNRFNLIDEPWIPIADVGLVGLRQVFENRGYAGLGGSPVEKLAIFKLLLAIASSAIPLADEEQWRALTTERFTLECLNYLEKWRAKFFLYGEAPFLQMASINSAKLQSFGAVSPSIATGNTTVLFASQQATNLDSAAQALLVVTLMGFALGGKKTDNSVVLEPGYPAKSNDKGKPSTGKPGPGVGHMGLLHTYLLSSNLIDSIRLNMLTQTAISSLPGYPSGIGVAPWEQMPATEHCAVAQALCQSHMGRLVSMNRFCLLADGGLHYSEGIAYPGYKEGSVDPSMAVNFDGKDPKALWVDPEKRPWRELPALLALTEEARSNGFQCNQTRLTLNRARDSEEEFYVWSAGLRVSSNAGEQYVSGNDDFVDSVVGLQSAIIGESWFAELESELAALQALAKNLYGKVLGYYKEQSTDGGKLAAQASNLFWQLSEREFHLLIDACAQSEEAAMKRQAIRRVIAKNLISVFDRYCPNESARQLDAWARFRPRAHDYIFQERQQ